MIQGQRYEMGGKELVYLETEKEFGDKPHARFIYDTTSRDLGSCLGVMSIPVDKMSLDGNKIEVGKGAVFSASYYYEEFLLPDDRRGFLELLELYTGGIRAT